MCSVQFPMGAGADGPLGGMAGMEPHHMNGSLGTVANIFHAAWKLHNSFYLFKCGNIFTFLYLRVR